MDSLCRIASGFFGVLLPGIWLAVAVHPAYADRGGHGHMSGRRPPPVVVQPGVPSTAQPFQSPPGFVDRSPPISQRPFAQPFMDRGPAVADRPLAPIGGGTLTVPGSAPFVWCQGQWLRAIPPSSGCVGRE
jgi:hypothetical protein